MNKDSLYYQGDYKNDIESVLEDLSDDYDVRIIKFDELTYNDSIVDFTGNQTDISGVFDEIISRYAGMNLGAVIIATDGVFNKGSNPVYAKNLEFPVYSLALGDTISQKDLILKNLMHNKLAFLGNRFPLRVYIAAEKCPETKALLSIFREGKLIYEKEFDLPLQSDIKMLDIELPADKLGVQQYDLKLEYLDDEISYDNNTASFVINVIDNRNKVLVLGEGPHPDIGAINFALKDNPDFEVRLEYIDSYTGSISDYNIIVLHQLPSNINNAAAILADIEKNKLPVLFILGSKSSLAAINNLDRGLSINSKSINTDDAEPYFNSEFVAFGTGFDEKTFFEEMSPLKVVFGDYKVLADSKIFLYQKINGVKTDKPLILFSEQNGIKTGFVTGEGIWRWRIDDFKSNSGNENFKALINRILQYMIVKKMQDKLMVE
ncbi:MAG: hypothetical protein C0596_12530 [Marinilabiliales bacterium]|nr:MAG: hypothetical protein C0596_12530 [Marinilabiliales bacterium]